jgi:hypothetical protein
LVRSSVLDVYFSKHDPCVYSFIYLFRLKLEQIHLSHEQLH